MLVSESTDDSRTIKDKNTKMIFLSRKMIYIYIYLHFSPAFQWLKSYDLTVYLS